VLLQEEEECKELLNSKLLQRCSWEKPRLSSARFCGEDEEIPRIKLPQVTLASILHTSIEKFFW
jgi:hypothetical protein